ncbi:1,4-alpha-glucan branching protein GlgB [Sphingomonas parva]|uniref:1,4-alpha-glucan branching protein GlgB n=1 Tax=Sphingomonas parva TaxID=2555898 RepID=UPI001CDC73E8|nr:1,4-alpha-glucan branching protein GlgB [Sphingomonas parva]
MAAIAAARHADPFAILGPHKHEAGTVVRAFVPGAERLTLIDGRGKTLGSLERVHDDGFFEGLIAGDLAAYRFRAERGEEAWELADAYRFGPVLGPLDDHLLGEGAHRRLWERLGAHPIVHEGVAGVAFAVWAPNARRVAVVGDFNRWDGRRHPMRKRVDSGIWEIFVPELEAREGYKYEIIGPGGELLPLKADPVGMGSELRPGTASVVERLDAFPEARGAYAGAADPRRAPMSIYEVHLGSWQRRPDGGFNSYDMLAERLVPYAAEMGFTHLEFLPVSEHPLDDSWGYQPIGMFAPTRRFGDPAGFGRLVRAAHDAGLGVILDWVPAHFPCDVHGLARFDGTHLYDHPDPRRGFHPDWRTAIYDFGRREVVNYLIANALYWLEVFGIDGLRVDAVASMLYLDYSRAAGEWVPNAEGGRENREAEAFLRELNAILYGAFPDRMTIAEESTAWPGVSAPVHAGGLGFGFKWNMGWMNDTLDYVSREPVHRRFHHHQLTFGLHYAFSENFILPLSHDEVVHGKKSIVGRMPGDRWQQFATARAYYGFMWGHPGKKLLFMGQEFGQLKEWAFGTELDWHLLGEPLHAGLKAAVTELNRLHRSVPALHARDCEGEGFRWIVADDADQSVLAWLRFGGPGDPPVAVVSNFTPVPRHLYRIGLPSAGRWREIFNSDAAVYGGSDMGNLGSVVAAEHPAHGLPASAEITIPPLSTLYLTPGDA